MFDRWPLLSGSLGLSRSFGLSFPGIIENQLELDQFMKASGTKVISNEVKEIIKMAVEFFKSPVDTGERSILNLLKVY